MVEEISGVLGEVSGVVDEVDRGSKTQCYIHSQLHVARGKMFQFVDNLQPISRSKHVMLCGGFYY